MVLLNNDLSAGSPAILERIDQPIVPPLAAGWYNRRKSHHFTAYSAVAEQFAALVGIDPWLIDPYFGVCGEINFQERAGEECLASNVDALLTRIAVKYAEYGIDEKPFVIVKADAGTYGMGIMTVRGADDVIGLEPQAAQQDGRGEGGPRGQRRSSSRKACPRSSRSTTRSPSPSST